MNGKEGRGQGRLDGRVWVGVDWRFVLRGCFVHEMRRGACTRVLLPLLIKGWRFLCILMMSREVDRIVLWDPEFLVTLGEFLCPLRSQSTRWEAPVFTILIVGWLNASTADLVDSPWNTLEDDHGEDASNQAIGNVETDCKGRRD